MKLNSIKRRRFAIGGIGFIVITLWFCFFIGLIGGNIRTVSDGKAYRSAQLTGGTLSGVLKEHHVKTVINLRGGHPGEELYDGERQVVESNGAQLVDIAISARRLPPPDRVAAIIDAFKKRPGPFLIHCAQGADRTGLASTIFRIVVDKLPVDEAQSEQLTWRYGHFPVSKTASMDHFFDLYRSTNEGLSFEQWALQKYPEVYAKQNQDEG